MRINIATLFPEMCEAVLDTSIIGRARNSGKVDIKTYNIRDYTLNKHRNVDDTPYGGGHGMVMQAQPVYDCCRVIAEESGSRPFVIFTTAAGKVFDQQLARELAQKEGLLCGISSGTNVAAALALAKKLGKGKTVVAILPDTGERYFTTPLFE